MYYTENTRNFAVDALPQLVLIDGSNLVRRIFVGAGYQETEQLKIAIAKLLSERQ